MKKYLGVLSTVAVLLGSLLSVTGADARTRVHGYYRRRTGTYLAPHYRSSPNHSRRDNWSTKGNYNPFTATLLLAGYPNWQGWCFRSTPEDSRREHRGGGLRAQERVPTTVQ